jgi:hypothetical protein
MSSGDADVGKQAEASQAERQTSGGEELLRGTSGVSYE